MRHPVLFLFYLALLSMLGFLATDMYLPAFDAMKQDLATSAGTISASLSLFLAGFACGQLFWGPLSDRLGRKPVLLAGLGIFTVACLAVCLTASPLMLLIWRFVQAFGVCAAAVSWQSLVMDHYPAHRRQKIFATVMPLVALSPALAPLLGAWLLEHYHWRSVFVVLAAITLLLMAATLRVPRPRQQDVSVTDRVAADTDVSFLQLLKDKGYRGNVTLYAACSASFFAWLTGSPFILTALGLSPADIGLSYLPQTLTFLAGGFGCRMLMNRFSSRQLLPWLLAMYGVSIALIMLDALAGQPSLAGLLIPFCGLAMANGAIYPIVVSAALSRFPGVSGKAAALQNTLQLGLCFLFSLFVSSQPQATLVTTVCAMGVTVMLALYGYCQQKDFSNRT
ncbi:purine nucleoside transporter PunC [Tatumella saanichensis]|uniref:purine nucleoside transporter PunC n=1 Tax=Tatumella saanichensis TaxID=480813 RepID=UPI0004A33A27|nr:purine nucleoside transporter PunC [Tatumella saanichensis]